MNLATDFSHGAHRGFSCNWFGEKKLMMMVMIDRGRTEEKDDDDDDNAITGEGRTEKWWCNVFDW